MFDRNSALITIVMPTYNVQHYIVNSINSILSQTSNDYQLFIIDDHSTDNTADMIRLNFKSEIETGKIHLFVLDRNLGPSYARQVGLDSVDTPYVTFVDSDDSYIASNVICSLVEVIKRYEPDCVMFKYITNHGRFKLKKKYKLPAHRLLSSREAFTYKITKPSPIWHYLWNKCYKMDVIKRNNIQFDYNLRVAEDVKFNQSFLLHSNNLLFLNKYFYLYNCTNQNSVSKKNSYVCNIEIDNSWRQYMCACDEYDLLCKLAKDLNCMDQCRRSLRRNLCIRTAEIMLKSKKYSWYDNLKYKIYGSSHFEYIRSMYWHVYMRCMLLGFERVIRLYVKKIVKN